MRDSFRMRQRQMQQPYSVLLANLYWATFISRDRVHLPVKSCGGSENEFGRPAGVSLINGLFARTGGIEQRA
jgi:hypothetical protein